MKIHEYQAAALFAAYGVRVPEGQMAKTAAEAEAVARALGEGPFVIKAQVHSGGRGKAGGVKFANTPGGSGGKGEGDPRHDAGDEADRPAGAGGAESARQPGDGDRARILPFPHGGRRAGARGADRLARRGHGDRGNGEDVSGEDLHHGDRPVSGHDGLSGAGDGQEARPQRRRDQAVHTPVQKPLPPLYGEGLLTGGDQPAGRGRRGRFGGGGRKDQL